MRSCNEMKEQIPLYLDHALDEKACLELEAHMQTCEACKREYEESRKVLELCKNLPEEALPEGFGERLHERLLQEKESLERRAKQVELRNKYIKTFSGIAAGIVVVVLLGGIGGRLFMGGAMKNANMTGAGGSAQEQAAAHDTLAADDRRSDGNGGQKEAQQVPMAGKAESKAMAPVLPEQPQATDSGAAGEQQKSSPAADLRTASAAKAPGSTASQPPVDTTESFQAAVSSRQESMPERNMAAANSFAIVLDAENPEDMAAKINARMVAFGGSNSERPSTQSAVYADSLPSATSYTVAGQKTEAKAADEIVVKLKIPKDNYAQFLEDIKATPGVANLQIDAGGDSQAEERIEALNEKLKALDGEISGSAARQDASARSGVEEQKKEREQVEKELENTRNDALQNIFITIVIKKSG